MARDVKGTQIQPGTKTANKDAVLFTAGEAITADKICYASSAGARSLTLKLASSAAPATASGTLYVSTNGVASGHESKAYPVCTLTGVNTLAGSVGDPVYLSTAGGWSLTPGAVGRRIGTVIVDSATVGEILFNGHLDDGAIRTNGVTTVAMNDTAHALVLGTAGAAETQLISNLVICDPESAGASEDLTLPPEASCKGMVLFIFNSGGEGIVVKDDGGGTVCTLVTTEHCIIGCDGTTWRGGVVTAT